MQMLISLKALLKLPRVIKHSIVITADILICMLTCWLAFFLRLGEFTHITSPLLWVIFTSICLSIPLFYVFGLYKTVYRHVGRQVLLRIGQVIAIYGLFFILGFTIFGKDGVPRTIGIIQPILLLLGITSTRFLARYILGYEQTSQKERTALPKALIYGAGALGKKLEIALKDNNRVQIIGFLDDDKNLQGNTLNGLKIYDPQKLDGLTQKLGVKSVLMALPKLDTRERQEKLRTILKSSINVRTLPSFADLAEGSLSFSTLRSVDIEDLLGRDTVPPDKTLLQLNIQNKIVLVTGAGGSIGGELCRQILSLKPSTLLLFEQNEYSLYTIHEELVLDAHAKSIELIPLIGSVLDETRLEKILNIWSPDTIFHAAAYKHVPLVEQNLLEGIKTNILGTDIMVRTAIRNKIKTLVLISTDKAVRPTNIMGASKRVAEMLLQAHSNTSHECVLTMVRFGNVLGSSGSVIPKFKKQIESGGPLTLTHKDITRYFMTISEASQLVIQAGAMANGGDVFVLDMGEPVKIYDLAERMIELSGHKVKNENNPDGNIEIKTIGLRSGEKLYEELLIGTDRNATSHPRIFTSHENYIELESLNKLIGQLKIAISENDVLLSRQIISTLVPEYKPITQVVDWTCLNQ